MYPVLLSFFLWGTCAASWTIHVEETPPVITMGETWTTTFWINSTRSEADDRIAPGVSVEASCDERIATMNAELLRNVDAAWYGSLNVTGAFLGSTRAYLSVLEDGVVKDRRLVFTVTVIRQERTIDKVFTASVAVLVSLLYVNFGCAMDWSVCRNTVRRPVGPAIGFFCQFLFMPLLSYAIGYLLFPEQPELQIGMFFTGISPSGGASNIWTVLLEGNLNLSVTMTTICTIAAFGMMPLWIFTLGKSIFERGEVVVPYSRIGTFAVGLVVPLAIGYLIQKRLPRLCRILIRIMKPFSVLLILFIIVFAIETNLYLFDLFSLQIVIAGMGLPWLGFLFGLLVAQVCRQPWPDVKAISIETGIQNTGVAIFLLRFTLPPPAADLTTVVPVSSAIMTPVPLTLLWLAKLIYNGRKSRTSRDEASMEKLRSGQETQGHEGRY